MPQRGERLGREQRVQRLADADVGELEADREQRAEQDRARYSSTTPSSASRPSGSAGAVPSGAWSAAAARSRRRLRELSHGVLRCASR